jgi:thymidylate synthase (FAD)
MPLVVRVIAFTSFVGVPPELLPGGVESRADLAAIAAAGQDQGTEAERLVECAGRTCYDSYGKGRPSRDYHQHIMDVDHGSVTEHATLSFFLSGISRGCTHELVRHRVGVAISQRSTRYVDENASDWALHPLMTRYFEKEQVRRASNGEPVELTLKQQANHVVSTAKRAYAVVVQALEADLIASGTDKFTARKQARGAARGLLGNALSTEMVWTCNIRALKGILAQRANRHADAEIRLLANALYEAALPYWPTYLGRYLKRECPDGIGFELYLPATGGKS